MYRSMQNIDRQHDVKPAINDGRARIAMNGEIPSVPITTLAGISSLTDLLPEMPLPSPLPHTLSNKSLLFHPRVAEEANNLLKLRDENLVPLLANSLSQTTSDHIELKDHYASTDQLIDCQFQPELLKAIVQKNPTVFKNTPAFQRHGWQGQRPQQQMPMQQQIQKQNYHQASVGQPRMQQQNQQYQQQIHHQKPSDAQQQTRHVSQSPQQQQMQSPQQSMQQSPLHQMQPQYHSLQQQQQQQQHRQPMQQQHPHQGVIAGSSSKVTNAGANFNAKSVIASNYNTMGGDYVNNAINAYPATCRPMQVNRIAGSYGDGMMNSSYSQQQQQQQQQQQHNYVTPGQQNAIHQVAGTSKSQYDNQASNYNYSNVIQNMGMQSSSMLASMPTPTPTPSSTPTQSPTRFIQRASVITSENDQQQNGMYSLPNVDKFLMGDDINLNMNDQSMVPELNSSVLLQSNVVEQLPPILDPSTNQPIQIPPQLQSQIESHLQLNGQQHLGGQIDSHDMYPADIGNLLNDVSSSIPIISGDLSMTPPLSSSIPQLDSVPRMQGISPHNNYDLPENVTPLLDSEHDLFNKYKEISKKEPVIKLHRLTENDLKQTLGVSDGTPANKNYPLVNNDLISDMETKKNNWFAKHMTKDADQKKGDYEISISERITKRKRNSRIPDVPMRDEDYVPKPKLKKLERKLVPVLEKLTVDELMETNTYQKFNQSIDRIFENMEDADMSLGVESDDEIPEETLIQKYQLLDLCSEAAKLKSLGCMESIPTDRLIRLLGILEKNIRSGIKVSPIDDDNDDEYQRKLWLETVMERVSRAVDASLIALYVLTSPNMHKKVYLEDVIDRIIMFAKYQLHNTIYPAYDPVYRTKRKKDIVNSSSRNKKKPNAREVRDKSVIGLYTKLVEVVSLLAELLNIQPLTDNSILHLSTLGVGPFFVEGINELQLNALKLVTSIFMKYEKHRKLLLDDILASMARLPSSKQSLRSYRLSSQEHIQMLTALVLQLIQCMVVLPKSAASKRSTWDPDAEISRKFKAAQASASNFLVVFLAKCSSKSEEIDYRPLFENFVQDLLTTVNKPEWPVSELMLSVLGKLLVSNFINKGVEMPLRVASLDYLGVVAARLRKDSVVSHLKLSTIDTIIKDIRAEEFKDEDKPFTNEDLEIKSDEERTQFLQRVLLDYLAVKSHSDESQAFARHFYICQWYQDALSESSAALKSNKLKPKKKNKKRWKNGSSEEESESSEDETEEEKKEVKPIVDEKFELRKQFFLSKVNPFETVDSSTATATRIQTEIQHTYIDYESAELVSRYLASKRPFSKSFETFLKHIINVLMESSVLIRTKAMKCLTMIVEADPSVLALKQMQMGVRNSFLDHSTSVREAAVDLVGKFILSQPNLIDDYYDMLSARILDTGVSVRKRVIKILKDICIEYPDYPKIPEICVKMIRRVNDEDGIRKLVMEVFQNMWFTPVREQHGHGAALKQKVMNITEVVLACKDMGLEWFEQLLVSLFKPKEDKDDSTKVITEPPKVLVTACKQIVDSLVDSVISLDGRGGNAPQRLVACVTTLYLFAKIRPQLLIEHAITLQPYLSLKCQTSGDYKIISCVARILEIVVPMLEHASEMFLSQLEEDSVKLIFQHDQSVILSCISCLGSVVNNVTHNFTLIRDCFLRYFNPLKKLKNMLESGTNANMLTHPANRASIRRSMYIVGLMLRFFDFKKKEVRGDKLPENIVDEVFETLSYFMHVQDQESCKFALISVGSMCIRHYDYMMGAELKAHYQMLLTGSETPVPMKVQVLNNIKFYLQEEEKRMIKQDEEWAVLSKQENLKEMNDVSSGMASTIIQIYLKDILEAFLHPNSAVRQAALGVIQMILAQGLVHPVQIVPYLICMSTDDDRSISSCADKQLQDIEKKYPGFIHMKAQIGIKLSFKLQKIIQGMQVARGFRVRESELPTALNGFLYSILRSKQQRRALVLSILKQFEEQVKTSLIQMLYLADNVAYFPYQVLDEPLFIIHHINIMISVTGTNLLQSFKESLLPSPKTVEAGQDAAAPDEDDDEDEESLLKRMPDDTTALQECITASQGCLMLLVLKQHLKTLYGFTDSKIALYSPSESAKVYEKSLNRKNNSRFHPKAALHKLQSGVNVRNTLDEKAKRELIAEYLEFKQLIISLDREDEDEDDEKNKSLPSAVKANNVCNSNVAADESRIDLASSSTPLVANSVYLQQPTGSTNFATPTTPNAATAFNANYAQQVTPLRVPKVKIIAPRPPSDSPHHSHSHSHRSHKSKKSDRHKKHHHKRKKKSYRSDESDDADSDPDYSV